MPVPLAAILTGAGVAAPFIFGAMNQAEREAQANAESAQNLDNQLMMSRLLAMSRRDLTGSEQLSVMARALQERQFDPFRNDIARDRTDALIQDVMRRHQERIAMSSMRSEPSLAERLAIQALR